jgi:hypothetical protein
MKLSKVAWIGVGLAMTLSPLEARATTSETRTYVGPAAYYGEVTCLNAGPLSPSVPGQGGACFAVPAASRTMSVIVRDDHRPRVRFGVDEFDASGECPDTYTDHYGNVICDPPIGIMCGTQASVLLHPRTVRVEVMLNPSHLTRLNEPCESGGGWATTGTITASFSA